jgi:hypothetical protein
MELIVSAAGLEVSPQTIRSLSQRLDLAVDRLETILKKVTVHLERTQNSRSHLTTTLQNRFDLACRIQLILEEIEPIELEDMDNNLEELLDRITERLGVIVSKRADERNLVSMLRKSRTSQPHKSPKRLESEASSLPDSGFTILS